MKERESFTKKWKRVLALTLTFVIVFSIMPTWVAHATETDESLPEDHAIIAHVTNPEGGIITVEKIAKIETEAEEEFPKEIEGSIYTQSDEDNSEVIGFTLEDGYSYQITLQINEDYENYEDYEVKLTEEESGFVNTDINDDGVEDGVYTYKFDCTEDSSLYEFSVDFKKTKGRIALSFESDEIDIKEAVGVKVTYTNDENEITELTSTVEDGYTYTTEIGKDYTIEVTPQEGYAFEDIDGTYTDTFECRDTDEVTGASDSFNAIFKVYKTTGTITINATGAGTVNVEEKGKDENDTEYQTVGVTTENGKSTAQTEMEKIYRITVVPDTASGYEVTTTSDEFDKDEEDESYTYVFECKKDELSYDGEVTFALRNQKLDFVIEGTGALIIDDETYTSDNSLMYPYGTDDIKVKIVPEPGFEINKIIYNDNEINDSDIEKEDTAVTVSLPELTSDSKLEVEFLQIESTEVNDMPEDIQIDFSKETDSNSKVETDSEIKYIVTKGENVKISHKDDFKISFNKEKKILFGVINTWDFDDEKVITQEQTLSSIWILENPFSQKEYKFNKPITFIFDTVSPTVTLEKDDKESAGENAYWLSGKETGLTLTGTITDQGTEGSKYKADVDRIVWSTEALQESEVLAETDKVVTPSADGSYTISIDATPQADITYYIYGVDKASNVSDAVTRTYCVDQTSPTVTDITTTELVEKRGVYYTENNKVSFTVTALDTDEAAGEGAGVATITIYQDGVAKETQKVDSSNSAEFTITLSDTADNIITASATDKVGNITAVSNYGKFSNGAVIVHDTSVPEINVDLSSFYSNTNAEGKTTYYEKQDKNIAVSFGQKKSGLSSVNVSINGVSLTEDANGKSFEQANADYRNTSKKKTTNDSFVISTAEAAALADGDYEIVITATSNVKEDEIYTQTFYIHKENQAPVISNYDVLGAASEAVTGTDVYGYYANTGVTAEVSLSDGSTGAGIKTVSYHFVDNDGKAGSDTTLELNKRPGEDTVIQIPIDSDFKGYVYVKTVDNVGNTTTDYYTTTGILTEKADSHSSNAVVDLKAAATSNTDVNGNNLYTDDTTVAVTVADTYAGIRSVEWSVTAQFDTANNKSGVVTIDNNGNVSDGSWNISSKDKNLVTQMTYTIPVTNNSNNITVRVKLTDCAGNITEKSMTLSIDKSAPVISLEYNDVTPDESYTSIYKDTRVATVTVKERSFDASAIDWQITSTHGATPQISGWTEITDAENPDNNTYIATITFVADDDYSFAMNYTDRAGNAGASFGTQTFTIDQTVPVIEVSIDGQPNSSNYYAAGRTATVKITEHNFDSNRIVIKGTATDNGTTTTFPVTSGWTTDGDVHTATISFDTDGTYAFMVDGIDEAGNTAEQNVTNEFVVDLTEPTIEISGVEDFSANNDVVAPVIQFSDTNYNEGTARIELVGANQGVVEANGSYSSSENGQIFTFADFAYEQDVDDIYTLTATEIDFAGNETSQSITFSVNRFGSVYVFDHSLQEIEGTYIKEPIDVVLTETNVDSLSMDSIKVTVSENGAPKDLSEGTEYTVTTTGGSGSWSQYTYTIDKSVFSGDGSYLVTIYSEDSAGNVNENINETKKAEIDFGVDGTAPVIVPINIEDGQSYNAQTYNATASVVDNLVLQDVQVSLDGKEIACTQDGDNINFDIPEASTRQEVVITARDAAGNEVQCKVANFLVSTNAFVRVMNNIPVVATVAGGVVAIGGGAGAFIGFRKKKVIHIKRKK